MSAGTMGVSAKIMMWGLNDFLVLRLNLSQVSSQVSEVRLNKSQPSLKAAKFSRNHVWIQQMQVQVD